jgi:hypothetical protein
VGGGRELAHELGVELLAKIPLRDDVADGGDEGIPVAWREDDEGAFHELALRLMALAPSLVPAGCTARLLDALDAAVTEG